MAIVVAALLSLAVDMFQIVRSLLRLLPSSNKVSLATDGSLRNG